MSLGTGHKDVSAREVSGDWGTLMSVLNLPFTYTKTSLPDVECRLRVSPVLGSFLILGIYRLFREPTLKVRVKTVRGTGETPGVKRVVIPFSSPESPGKPREGESRNSGTGIDRKNHE